MFFFFVRFFLFSDSKKQTNKKQKKQAYKHTKPHSCKQKNNESHVIYTHKKNTIKEKKREKQATQHTYAITMLSIQKPSSDCVCKLKELRYDKDSVLKFTDSHVFGVLTLLLNQIKPVDATFIEKRKSQMQLKVTQR